MRLEKDYKDFFEVLNKNEVKYCIVGAVAVTLHGYPRYTKDVDILIEPKRENAQKLLKAIKDFGFESLDINENDILKKDNIIQLGYEPIRIDLIMAIPGFEFEQIWEHKKVTKVDNVEINYIGLDELIKTKSISALEPERKKDLIDVEALKKIKSKETD
ncbi:MAG: hypothetical protein ABII74_09900 [Elusimicrobiota bacterium]